MNDIGGMSGRVFGYSAGFHLAVAVTLYVLVHWHLFDRKIAEETPLVVRLVNLAPETRATEVARTPPKPEKPPEVADLEIPKPPELKPEPPKPPETKPTPPPPPPPPQEMVKVPPPPAPPPPDAKPQVAKVEPKPDLPKPPDPKPVPPKKKQQEPDDNAWLNTLAKNSPMRTPEEARKQVAAAPPKASSQPIAPLGPQLTTSEMDGVKEQLRPCWLIQAGARDAANLTPEFRVFMNRDGTVRDAKQLNPERNSDPFFQAAADAAARALRNPQCQPLKLPLEKYDQWQTFTIIFDPKERS